MTKWWIVGVAVAAMACSGGASEGSAGDDDDDDDGSTAEVTDVPESIEELAEYLFRHFDDTAEIEAGVASVDAWLADNAGSPEAWALDPLSDDSLGDVDRPEGASADDLIGAFSAAESVHGALDQAAHLTLQDQRQIYGNDYYELYLRSISVGSASDFADGAGELEAFDNVISRVLLSEIPYGLDVDMQWVGETIVVRKALPERGCTESESTCLNQSYGIEVYGGAGVLRASWAESLPSLGDDLMQGALGDGLVLAIEASEGWLDRQ